MEHVVLLLAAAISNATLPAVIIHYCQIAIGEKCTMLKSNSFKAGHAKA